MPAMQISHTPGQRDNFFILNHVSTLEFNYTLLIHIFFAISDASQEADRAAEEAGCSLFPPVQAGP